LVGLLSSPGVSHQEPQTTSALWPLDRGYNGDGPQLEALQEPSRLQFDEGEGRCSGLEWIEAESSVNPVCDKGMAKPSSRIQRALGPPRGWSEGTSRHNGSCPKARHEAQHRFGVRVNPSHDPARPNRVHQSAVRYTLSSSFAEIARGNVLFTLRGWGARRRSEELVRHTAYSPELNPL
jgi:hypothetical protein